MSTVLWANQLLDGKVTSDESDKYALHRHCDKLDRLCDLCGVLRISDICDTTDMRFNFDEIELPDGMTSTDEVMAVDGAWVEADRAVQMIEALLSKVEQDQVRFGMLRNARDDVVAELQESLAYARNARQRGAKFNFSIVT